MIINRFSLTHFKNHARLELFPSSKWNVITGLNGCGKTNLLDAIHMACLIKSFLHHDLDSCIHHGQTFFRIELSTDREDQIHITFPTGGQRKIELNGKRIDKPSDYIGRFPVMVIQPIDDYKLMEGSLERRRIIDQAIAQTNPPFLRHLLTYNKIIRQRNSLLRRHREQSRRWSIELEMYDPLLTEAAAVLIESRARMVEQIESILPDDYKKISSGHEIPTIHYAPNVSQENYSKQMKINRLVDIQAGRTTAGPHLDDLDLQIDGHSLRSVGSQGQRKSFMMALKLSLYRIMCEEKQTPPILLLDDLFDKLDNQRVSNLLSILDDKHFGQIFITDKDDKHLRQIFSDRHIDAHMIQLPPE